ncbi:ATP-binding protein [uncultured Treponema sp.]|uniref:ATP-dependent nuclease n=1 Tax=uncultured Treponema sp. TaxID=162155 RepID=UPI0025830CBC|nr:ATP-binding protein [uncultured Treponema sp.]
MKLKSLWLKDYKNLKDFHLDFEKGNGLSILIGNNGSGKSNVLEAISGIFAEWYGKSSYKFDTDYEVIYDKDNLEFRLNRNGRYKRVNPFINNHEFLPTKVIATYTGENPHLYENFYKQFKRSSKMLYCDKNLWTVSFLILVLYSYKYTDIAHFLKEEFNIIDGTAISITIKLKADYYSVEKDVENLIDQINNNDFPEEFTLSLDDLRMRLGRSKNDDDLYYQPRELFDIFSRACNRVHPMISQLDIIIDSHINVSDFSEGEKKLILIKAILEFIADEDSLLLLDEPDANVHESRKVYLYHQIKKYASDYSRQIIMTTHSPIIAKMASKNELIYLESKKGKVEEIETEKLDLIKNLASNEWNIMEAGVFLNSGKPLVLFEGKSDIIYVKKAIELLKPDNPKYEKINIDILSFNGTGNAEEFLKNIREITPNKKLIFFFDRDSGGKDGMSHVIGRSKDDELIIHYRDYEDDAKLLKAAFLPYPNDNSEQSFMIEDYFPEEKIEEIFNELITIEHPYTKVISKKFEEKFKENLEKKCQNYSKSDFQSFTVLLDKLLELLEIS